MTEMDRSTKGMIVFTLIGVAAVAGYFAGTSQNVSDEIAIAQDEQKFCHQNADCVAWLNENYVSEVQRLTEKEAMLAAIAAPHVEFNSMGEAISRLNGDMQETKLRLNALEQENTPPSSSSSDFDLMTCSDFNCVDEEDRFNQGETIYIRGDNPTNDRSLELRIYDPDNVRIHDANISTVPNSPFIAIYEIENDADEGTYRVVVELDRDEDEINFIVS